MAKEKELFLSVRYGMDIFTIVNIVSLIIKHVCLLQIHHPSKPI